MTGPSVKVRRQVLDRASDRAGIPRCEVCRARGGQIHHRRPRGMGGTSLPWVNMPANLLLLCGECHAAVESFRDAAEGAGLLLPYSVEDAWSHPVVLWRGTVWLDDDGRYLEAEVPA